MFAVKYKKTGKVLGFSTSANQGEFCVDVTYEFWEYSDNIWVVADRRVAERAASSTSEWYNADFDTPMNAYVGECEVVEVVVK